MAELPDNINMPSSSRQQMSQQQQGQHTNNQIPTAGILNGPRSVVLHRHNDGFGFTLRHFIVYPPESCSDPSVTSRLPAADLLNFAQPMDTVFVKKVHPNSPAFYAGLQEGDRLLAVNGLPVTGIQYAQVVATIQQTPKTLKLQVVPKAYDILQTYFSDTAHNPETNQRPMIQQSQQQIYSARQHPTQQRPIKMTRELNHVQEKQESLYSTLQEIAGTVQPQPPPPAQPQSQQISKLQHQRQQFFLGPTPTATRVPKDNESMSSVSSFDSNKTTTTLSNSEIMMMGGGGDSAIMSRLRKSFEQKEEFLKRPNNAFTFNVPMQNAPMQLSQHEVQQREFYSRPNRLQKPVWPPVSPIPMILEDKIQPIMPNSAPPIPTTREHGHLSAIREQFFNGSNMLHIDPKQQQIQQIQQQQQQSLPLSPPALHLVQEKTKLFESGRPLSPDGIDRTELYKSELSRLSTKQVVPNVAVRRKEFELKAENTGWRRSIEEKPRSAVSSDSESKHPQIRVRSLSAESTKDQQISYLSADEQSDQFSTDKENSVSSTLLRQKPVRENSYLNAVRNANAFWLQGPPPAAFEPSFMSTPSLRHNYANKENRLNEDQFKLKMLHRNQTIVEIHNQHLTISSNDSNGHIRQSDVDDGDVDMKNLDTRNPSAPIRPTTLNFSPEHGQVVLRQKQATIEEEDRKTRRISYLRATANDNAFHMESDNEGSPMSLPPDTPDTEPDTTPHHHTLKSHGAKSKALSFFRDPPPDSNAVVIKEGELNVKVTLIDGKRSQDRSWRTVHAELRGTKLKLTLIRDGKGSNQSPEPSGIIDLTNFHVAEGNYTKRKNVFKLTTVSSYHQPVTSSSSTSHLATAYKGYERELLVQADNHNEMKLWMDSLRTVCRSNQYLNSHDYISNNSNGNGNQQAEPQRVAALTTVQSLSNDEFSPILSAKSQRKGALGTRSPSGQSPVTKSRKTPQNSNTLPALSSTGQKDSSDKETTGSPKSKTWKGIVARQFRKIQGQPGSPGSQNTDLMYPEGASINVPLHLCPPSDENPYVPFILAKCTGIVESRGLSVVGIYRIPGNTAAISQLTELVNRGLDEPVLRDPKWDDVNVVSSLLKSFIRNLPEPLIPTDMYNSFINADKIPGQQRLIELRHLFRKVPTYCYETLKHIIRHLHCVSENCLVNLMDPRNLAIVFGPSVIKSANESLETAVKDMKHQCQIVEVLINHYEYFFEDGPLPIVVERQSTTVVDSSLEVQSASLLLDNVSKIEPLKESSKESSSRFVANIVQAANRKIRRTAQRKSTTSSMTPDTLSLDSTTSAESKEKHRYMLSDDSQKENQNNDPSTLNRSSEEDSNDSAFTDNGSMSLKTVTIALDNKLRSIRNSSIDSDVVFEADEKETEQVPQQAPQQQQQSTPQQPSSQQQPQYRRSSAVSNHHHHHHHHRPLTIGGENIPYADESPERPLIQPRAKPPRQHPFNNSNTFTSSSIIEEPQKMVEVIVQKAADDEGDEKNVSISSDDTDTSTTSNPRESITAATYRIDTEVLRKMNRILTNLERKANNLERKFSLNRSLSLNYKNHKNSECCCYNNGVHTSHNHYNNNNNNSVSVNNSLNLKSRLSLTKDEKTDKNINRRRQIHDINNTSSGSNDSNNSYGGGVVVQCNNAPTQTNRRRQSIRRRHTVGGTQDYYPSQKMPNNSCHQQQNAVVLRRHNNFDEDKLCKTDVN